MNTCVYACKGASTVPLTREQARRCARAGALAAFALLLSYVETFIPLPIPVPGAKLGLSNVAVLMAFCLVDARCALSVAAVKAVAAGFLFGSPIMIPYSVAGTFLSFLAMLALTRVRTLHLAFASIAGSVAHITGQLVVAQLMLGTSLVWFSFPVLFVVACVTGALTGWMASSLVDRLDSRDDGGEVKSAGEREGRGLEALGEAVGEPSVEPAFELVAPMRRANAAPPRLSVLRRVDKRVFLLAFALYVVAVFWANGAAALGVSAALAVALVVASGATLREVARLFAPLVSVLAITLVAHVLYLQEGVVLCELGPFAVTYEALAAAVALVVRFACLACASAALPHVVDATDVTATVEQALRPLRRLGVRTDAALVTLDLALRFVPALVSDFDRRRALMAEQDAAFEGKGPLARLRAYARLLPEVAVNAFACADRLATDGVERG